MTCANDGRSTAAQGCRCGWSEEVVVGGRVGVRIGGGDGRDRRLRSKMVFFFNQVVEIGILYI